LQRLLLSLFLSIALFPITGTAQNRPRWNVRNLTIENDNVFPIFYSEPSDRFYSHGFELSLSKGVLNSGTPADRVPFWVRRITRQCESCEVYPTLSVGQKIFTPEDIESPDPQPGERPWAAWLYGGVGAVIDTSPRTRHEFDLQVGATGDAAGGRFIQRFWHKLIGTDEAAGWDNQFGSDFGINAFYTYQRISFQSDPARRLKWDFVPNVKVALGTQESHASIGATMRMGPAIADFPFTPIVRERGRFVPRGLSAFRFYGFAAVDFRAVGYNYYLEGSRFDDDLNTVEPKDSVRDFTIGFTALYEGWNITYSIVRRSEEFVRTVGTDRGIHNYGSLTISRGIE
jgi:lipid A 3-O-deacylase